MGMYGYGIYVNSQHMGEIIGIGKLNSFVNFVYLEPLYIYVQFGDQSIKITYRFNNISS